MEAGSPQSPGSYIEFREHSGLEAGLETARKYGEALMAYRLGLAEAQGVSPDKLHGDPPASLGRAALDKMVAQTVVPEAQAA